MKIIMLGHSGVGKTSYMAGMYDAMQRPTAGLTLRATRDADHATLLRYGGAMAAGKYPPGTSARSDYAFKLIFQGASFFEFSWHDYRGGALREQSTQQEMVELRSALATADGVLVFCDSESAISGNQARRDAGRIVQILSSARGQRESAPLPIAIVCTKADLISDDGMQQVLSTLDPLIRVISSSKTFMGALVPVSCGVAERNIRTPVLFLIHFVVSLRLRYLQALAMHSAEKAKRLRDEAAANRVSTTLLRLFGQGNAVTAAQEAERSATEQLVALSPLLEPTGALQRCLDGLVTF